MRNYQRTKNNPYFLPHNVYMQTLYILKDYPRLKQEEKDILYQGASFVPGAGRGNTPGDPTGHKAQMLDSVTERIRAVEHALETVPEEFRPGLMNNIARGGGYPCIAGEATWRRRKARLLHAAAKGMGWA